MPACIGFENIAYPLTRRYFLVGQVALLVKCMDHSRITRQMNSLFLPANGFDSADGTHQATLILPTNSGGWKPRLGFGVVQNEYIGSNFPTCVFSSGPCEAAVISCHHMFVLSSFEEIYAPSQVCDTIAHLVHRR